MSKVATPQTRKRNNRPHRKLDENLLSRSHMLRTDEVAELINYAPATIHNLVAQGRFPPPDKRGHTRNLWEWGTVKDWKDEQKAKAAEHHRKKQEKRGAASHAPPEEGSASQDA